MTRATITPVPGQQSLMLGAFEIADLGYEVAEFFIAGVANSYTLLGPLEADGEWQATRSDEAEFVTRIVVLKPVDDAKFSGAVVVEWLNVTGGIDAPAEWMMTHREIVRAGHAYVAVSAQIVGVEGGLSRGANMSLKGLDPARYAALHHPGDAFCYDIFSEVGRLLRADAADGVLGSLKAERVLAVGVSQSATFLVSYVNAVDPLAKIYDGFLLHSRFAPAAPLDGTSIFIAGPQPPSMTNPVQIRADVRVPVMMIITETDLVGGPRVGYYKARQPDSALIRTWEIAGAAHADNYMIQGAAIDSGHAPLSSLAASYTPISSVMGTELPHAINFAPQNHYVTQAALAALDAWVRTGHPAPSAPAIALNGAAPPRPVLDVNGMATGGVRTPWVDVPTAKTSGLSASDVPIASLFGSGEMFDAATLARLYPGGVSGYLPRFEAALDAAIRAGFIVQADREEILNLAAATYPKHV